MDMGLEFKEWNSKNLFIFSFFFITFGLLIVKIYILFLFWKIKWQGFDINIVHFPNFKISASL